MNNPAYKNIIIIGGGTGTYTVLSGIKKIPGVLVTAIVASTDSGGSSGILRDEFGNLPVGDFRQSLVALSKDSSEANILRELFMYRFDKGGEGLKGHNFGNLFITALTEILGSEEAAFRKASKILNVQGRVYPITFDKIELLARYEDDSIAYGEGMIDEPPKRHNGEQKIKELWAQPKSEIYSKTKEAILGADLIIFGPGDLYTSIIANLVIDGVPGVIKKSKAKILYISNLVSKYGQTHGFKVSNYVSEMEKYLKKDLDYVLVNSKPLASSILKKYSAEKAFPVVNDMNDDVRVILCDLLSELEIKRKTNDKVKRSLLRHDPDKIATIIQKVILPKI